MRCHASCWADGTGSIGFGGPTCVLCENEHRDSVSAAAANEAGNRVFIMRLFVSDKMRHPLHGDLFQRLRMYNILISMSAKKLGLMPDALIAKSHFSCRQQI